MSEGRTFILLRAGEAAKQSIVFGSVHPCVCVCVLDQKLMQFKLEYLLWRPSK